MKIIIKIAFILCALIASFSCDNSDTKRVEENSIGGKWNLIESYGGYMGKLFEKGQCVWYIDREKGELIVQSNLQEQTPLLGAGTYKMNFTDSTIYRKGLKYFYKVGNNRLFLRNSVAICDKGVVIGDGGYLFERD